MLTNNTQQFDTREEADRAIEAYEARIQSDLPSEVVCIHEWTSNGFILEGWGFVALIDSEGKVTSVPKSRRDKSALKFNADSAATLLTRNRQWFEVAWAAREAYYNTAADKVQVNCSLLEKDDKPGVGGLWDFAKELAEAVEEAERSDVVFSIYRVLKKYKVN